MPGATTNDRPSPNLGETGINGTSAAYVIRELPDRSPEASADANFAPADSPLPDNLCFIRLADWTPASRTQPRSGASQPADGGTIFFEGLDEFTEEFQFNPQLGLRSGDAEPSGEPRVVLWMRDGETALRSVLIDGAHAQGRTRIEPEMIGPAQEFGLQDHQEIHGRYGYAAQDAASPLLVWTLWTNPLWQ